MKKQEDRNSMSRHVQLCIDMSVNSTQHGADKTDLIKEISADVTHVRSKGQIGQVGAKCYGRSKVIAGCNK